MAVYLQPSIHGNPDVNNLIITAFTVFAGVVMALISAIGDPALVPLGSWRTAEVTRAKIDRQLIRHSALFFLYMGVIALFLGCTVLKGYGSTPFLNRIEKRVESLYIGASAFAFLLSMPLPLTMLKLQRRRLGIEVEKRRKEAGIIGG